MLQGPHKDFNLHTIGWQAFQDLAATIVEVDQGRPVSRVAKSKDEGRDGFLYGVPDEPLTAGDARETTIQCKHFDKAGRTLTLGSLTTELRSVRKLASSGRADGYMLITNASVTEAHRLRIVEALRAAGVTRPYVLGVQWVVEKILASPKVRALAPRVYGLGDLSWLKSDQARRQAAAILDTMGDDLRCYVPTKAHDDAVAALDRHGSVLLLGDPAVGKSSIAAALSVAATDEKDCDVIFVRNPAEFLRHWDPEVENRLFWVDDAFGSTKLETALMDPWNKVFSGMHAAIRRGNRFILTSRSHIWNEARRDLKQGAYAPLLHGHVVVDVAALKHAEQERILYNHLKFGSQDAAFVRGVRQFLDAVLAADTFRPEVARRLANPLYTGGLRSTEEGLLDFFARPEAFLRDTLMNLSDAQRAAIGLIFINGGRLRSPIEEDESRRLIETLYGVGVAGLRNALETLDGSFVLRVRDGDHAYWTYKHPTIGDGYALLIKSDQELVTLYVRGAKVEQLLDEAHCGGRVRGGILIPPELHATFLERLPRSEATADAVRRFLVHRSGEAFFKAAIGRFPKVLTLPRAISRPYARDLTARMKAKAAVYGCMAPSERSAFIHELRSEVADSGDVSFLTGDPLFDRLLSDEERDELERLARTDLDGRFDAIIDGEQGSYDSSWEPDDWFADIRSLVEEHATLFPDDQAVERSVARALKRIASAVETIEEGREPEEEWDGERSGTARSAVSRSVGRSIFDDLVPSS